MQPNERESVTNEAANTTSSAPRRKLDLAQVRGLASVANMLSEQTGDLIVLQDADGNFLDLSPSCLKILGYEREELIGRPSIEALHPETAKRMAERRATRDTARIEGGLEPLQVRRKDGSYVWIEAAYTYLRDDAGEVAYLLAIGRDITDRRQAEEALARNERLFRATFEQAAVGIVHVSLDGRFLRANTRMCRMLGYTPEEMTRLSFIDVTHPGSLRESVEARERMASGASSRWEHEKQYVRKDGTPFWGAATVSLVVDESGRPEFFVSAVVDITDRRALEENLLRARDELEARVQERTEQLSRANEELRHEIEQRQRAERRLQETEKLAATARLAAGVAHEINNPLGGIKNSFELIRDAVPRDHAYYHYVDRIQAEIERVAEIVREMYGLYEPQHEAATEFELRACLQDLLASIEPDAACRGISVRLMDQPATIGVHHSESRVRRVLRNLIENAIDASPDGGTVYVALMDHGDRVGAIVRDQGPGIPPELLARVFEPFFSTKGRRDRRAMGLGLAISRSLVEAMGGTIELDAAPGGGTLATLCLPKA